jgi:septum site-determining protein MinC
VTVSPALSLPHAAGGPASKRPEAFDLKGTMASFTVLRLRSTDLELVERQLRVKTAQLPSLFLDAPVLVDLAALGDEASSLPLAELVRAMRACKLVPVAAANVPEDLRGALADAGLGLWRGALGGRPQPQRATPDEDTETPAPESPAPVAAAPPPRVPFTGPVVVTKPVRGGQIVHARDNDMVVLAPVNPGAQVIADGHLHIYAPLRGRAVAGASGLPGARIFCQKLEAELVAVAGAYVSAEEIPADLRGRAVQIFLENQQCRITPL